MRTGLRIAIAIASLLGCGTLLCQSPQGIPLAHYPDIVGIAASYNYDDGFRTVIVARQNGEIHELFYKTAGGKLTTGVGDSVVATIPGVSAVASFYARDDNFRIVLAATGDGKLHEVFYHPTKGRGESVIGEYSSIRGLAGFYDPTTRNRVAIVIEGGSIPLVKELAYRQTTGKSERKLGGAMGGVTGSVVMCANYSDQVGTSRRVVMFIPSGAYQENFYPDTPHNLPKQNLGEYDMGEIRSVACSNSGILFASTLGVSGNWLHVSFPANKVALDSFDSTHAIVAASDGRILLFVKP